ncbi:MAG TPA: MBL fold metallo-hydrolase [Myxococcota bacterium]|nr:MBL fold metallo-hydrolase [Myxococcota bacterium]
MWGMKLPDIERWSQHVVVVRGQNPGPFTGPGTNTYLVGRGPRPFLLDTGAGVPTYLPLLEQALTREHASDGPGDLLITHVHGDHIGGASGVLARFGRRGVAKYPWPGRDERYDLDLTPIRAGDVFRAEGVTLRAIHTPGHAQDHICFYLEEERALFTGDVVLGAGTTVIPLDGGDMADYLASLERMLDLDLARIYPGHGPLIADPRAKLVEYIEHRRERERQIVAAVRGGSSTVLDMVERIYVDTPRALHPAAGQSVLSHLLKLERERRATRSRDAAGEEHWALA